MDIGEVFIQGAVGIALAAFFIGMGLSGFFRHEEGQKD